MSHKWGLIGVGAHGRRYLEERNNGGRVMIGIGRGVRPDGVDAVVIATTPASHAALAIECLELGIAVLLEKPIALTMTETRSVLDCASRPGMPPLLVASPHLYARKFLELPGGIDSEIVWAGPERADGSCSAYLDWGPHAFSMAVALGTDRVITGQHPTKLCSVRSGGREYHGQWTNEESPMLAMVETLERLMHGAFDWRASLAFQRRVYERLFAAAP